VCFITSVNFTLLFHYSIIMGVSSTTVGLVCTAIVLIFTGTCYYMFFYEKEDLISTSTNKPKAAAQATDAKTKDSKKKKSSQILKSSASKGFNAKAALSHATDHKDHALYWRELGGHVVAATCVAFSHPQHDLVASGSADGTVRCVRIAELGTPNPCEVYTKLEGAPDAMSFTQNAKRLVIASQGNIYFYSISVTHKLRKIELVKSFPCSLKQVHALQLLDVEQWMVIVVAGLSATDGTPVVQAFNPKGTLINEYQQVKRQGRADKNRLPNPSRALAVSSPDDRFIAIYGCGEANHTVGDGEVGVFEVERDSSGQTRGLKLSFVLAGHTSDVLCMAWNATG
jgi:WD40 repeat protein